MLDAHTQALPRPSAAEVEISPADLVPAMDLDLLSGLVRCPVDPTLRRAIAGSGRLRARIAARAEAELSLPRAVRAPDAPAIRRLAFGAEADVEALLFLAGGLSASGAIRRTVDRGAVTHLRAVLGPDVYGMILAEGGAPEPGGDAPESREAVRAAGLAALSDWLEEAGPDVAVLLRARFGARDAAALVPEGAAPGGRARIAVAAEMLEAGPPDGGGRDA